MWPTTQRAPRGQAASASGSLAVADISRSHVRTQWKSVPTLAVALPDTARHVVESFVSSPGDQGWSAAVSYTHLTLPTILLV